MPLRGSAGFTVAARAILELGAELISSDGVALYELLKNSIDAGSPQVRIEVNVALRHSSYEALLRRIEEGRAEYLLMRELEGRKKAKKFRSQTIQELVLEITNKLENDAPKVCRETAADLLSQHATFASIRKGFMRLYNRVNWIVVADTGEGMSLQDLQEVYLTIGTRSRQRVKPGPGVEEPGRVFLGEKGVGRLSTMRLGSLLSVVTTKRGEARGSSLYINWDWFSHDSDKLLEEIRVRPRRSLVAKEYKEEQGTVVTIRGLRSDWTEDKFKEIILDQFSRLIDPFAGRKASRTLRLFYNGAQHYPAEIEKRLLQIAHAECSASFQIEDGHPVLRGQVNYRLRGRERSFVVREPEIRGFVDKSLWPALLTLGPFGLNFWWYNRAALTDMPDLGRKREVQKRVARWTGGLMVFRNGYRINPYGSPDDDWLGLDKRAFSSRGFKLNRQQIIGRVSISWRNPELKDQTNREGLVETPQKTVFVLLLQQVLFKEFKNFVDRCDAEVRVQELTSIEDLQAHVARVQNDASRKLKEIAVRVPHEREAFVEVERLMRRLNGYVDQARELAEEYESERSKFVYLAGIGLMVEFILHELGRATQHTLETLRSVQSTSVLSPERLPSTFKALDDQLVTLVKRIETLDPLSTSRRQRKEVFNVFEVVAQVVEGRQDQARRHEVEFRGNFGESEPFEVNGVRGMFIQILENLLANSFFWLGVQREIDPQGASYIEIDIDPDSHTVSVTDSGTGVDPAASAEIFEAFVSHRPVKLGKGLGLYISRELAKYHDWTLDVQRSSTTRPGRYNTFVLDLSSKAQ